MKTKIIGIPIALMVSIVLLGSLLVPVIDDAKEGPADKITNGTPSWRMSELGAEYELSINPAARQIQLNDNSPLSYENKNVYLIGTDSFAITTYQNTAYYTTASNESQLTDPVSIAVSGGSATITIGDESQTLQGITWGIVYDPEKGTLGAYSYPSVGALYVHGLKDVTIISTASTYHWAHNGATTAGDALTGTITSQSSDYTDYNTVTNISDGGVYFNYVIVPVNLLIHRTTAESLEPLLNAIPVIVLASLVVFAIGAVAIKRY